MTKRCKKNRCGDRNRLFKWWNSFNEELSCDFNHLLMMRWKMNSTSSWPFCFLFRICSYLVGVEKKNHPMIIRHNTRIIIIYFCYPMCWFDIFSINICGFFSLYLFRKKKISTLFWKNFYFFSILTLL